MKKSRYVVDTDSEAVIQFAREDAMYSLLNLLDYVQHVLNNVVQVLAHDTRYPAEDARSGRCRVSTVLSMALVYLCITLKLLVRSNGIAKAQERDIGTAARTIHQIFGKLSSTSVYHDWVNRTLYAVNTMPFSVDELLSQLPEKMSTNYSAHGVLHNLTIKLVDDMSGLLNLLDEVHNPGDYKLLGAPLESLNCTLGSLNRALDPLPGGEYAMEAELYNVHLTPHKLPIVPTRISEPAVRYCCCSYKQLTVR
ncbi:hypothetical protein [Anaplasma bovis]|uniref:hypothetical protein n=1 Tax=Anaplasma bovis TaxID=186733 RepID=UPI002FEFC419